MVQEKTIDAETESKIEKKNKVKFVQFKFHFTERYWSFSVNRHLQKADKIALLLRVQFHLQKKNIQRLHKEKQQKSMVLFDAELRSRQKMGLLCRYVGTLVLLCR